MKACGNKPPIEIKNKGKWTDVERLRWARLFNIPIVQEVPEGFPPLTLSIMRCLCALALVYPSDSQKILTRALDAFFEAYWVHAKKTIEKDVMVEILGDVLESKEAVAKVLEVAAKGGKQLLLENTDMAFREGAFGLPWIVCENTKGEKEAFWGVDHLGCVVDFLGLEKPKMGAWRALL